MGLQAIRSTLFGEARQAREALRPEYTQAEIFNQVKRAPGRPCGSDE